MTSSTHSPSTSSFWQGVGWIVAGSLVWALSQWLGSANVDRYADMLEAYAWGQTLPWGTFKHPPFFAWVAHLWFEVFPRTTLSFFVLSYLNVAFGLVGVMVLARQLGLRHLALPAAMLLLLAFPYTTLAAKFNANSQLLSLWPWAAACMLGSWQSGIKAWVWTLGFGLTAAAAMLSKYYSGVFLLGLGLTALFSARGRPWLMSLKPWGALLVFVALLYPHYQWMASHDFMPLRYVQEQGGDAVNWRQVVKFALSPFTYWLFAWLLAAFLGRTPEQRNWRAVAANAWKSWLPQERGDVLFWLAFTPWAITLLFGIAGVVELSTPWSIPIGYAFSLLWLRNLVDAEHASEIAARIGRVWRWSLPVVLVLGVIWGISNAARVNQAYYRPDAEAAEAVLRWWNQAHPGQPIGWAGGNWAENALLAFYGDPAIRVLPGLPDQMPALLDPHASWQSESGVLICPLGATQGPAAKKISLLGDACETQVQQWLQQRGQPAQGQVLQVQRSGWRFPRALPFTYVVYPYLPSTLKQ